MNERSELRRAFRGALWGLAATAVMSVFMIIGGLFGGRAMRPFPMQITSQIFGYKTGFGVGLLALVLHFAYGAAFGLLFALTSRPMTVVKGIGYGVFLWGLMAVTFVPWMGWGDFGLWYHARYILYFLVLHLAYGVTIGELGARDERTHHARFDDLGRLEVDGQQAAGRPRQTVTPSLVLR